LGSLWKVAEVKDHSSK